jgi:protocatechuate 3,4-dioxygenase beta subunit
MAPLWRRLILFGGGAAVLCVAGYALWVGAAPSPAPGGGAAGSPGKGSDEFAWLRTAGANGATATVEEDKVERARQLVQHYGEVNRSLCTYREHTRYPGNSRPLSEQNDQMYPNRPVVEVRPMHTTDGSAQDNIQMQSSQSRVYMASGETVVFTIRATGTDGTPLPMFVTGAVAHGLALGGARDIAQVVVDFSGDGGTGENGYTGSLTPRQTNLAGFNGTIRVDVSYNVGDKSGTLSYDVIYSPDTPANWNGPVRESTEDGSLNFHLRANVLMPGRYVVTGRVDDARGRPVALATFNDVLGQGSQDVKLTVYGKLLADLAPSFPLTLRDVDGYLLKENTDPDRLLLPRLEGNVYTSKDYSAGAFSDAEWQSEERNRYLTELGKDVAEARDALHRFDPALEQQTVAQQRCD